MTLWRPEAEPLASSLFRHRFGFSGRVRTHGREMERVAQALLNPACRPEAILVSTFWWEKVKNFGDLLTPYLLRDVGVVPVLTPPAEADLVGVGSLIQHLPAGYSGTLWGTGLGIDQPVDLPDVTALAVRGDHTRDRIGNPRVDALGDPGLLISRRTRRQTVTHDIGLVSHYIHADDPWLADLVAAHPAGPDSVLRIGVEQSPAAVARQVAACRTIVSTSLHGVITADAFGIPAVWLRMPKALFGGDFKFHDHETVVRPVRPRGFDAADVDSLAELVAGAAAADDQAVRRAQEGLLAAARRIPDVVPHRRMATWRIPVSGRGRPVHRHV